MKLYIVWLLVSMAGAMEGKGMGPATFRAAGKYDRDSGMMS